MENAVQAWRPRFKENFLHLQLSGDLIQTYQIVRGRECALEFDEFVELARSDHLRGHPFKLQRKPAHMDLRRNAFSQSVERTL
ncbi:unnamed protein product [Dibothriocephalus latus]|uniref:Uncharacterized protein n=1 Tax=Dibothriocephalus latus TaxID=60516 RepID=A0A3P7LBP8_DIBLA|nr:unnamed protein product [Dibothriocephalus latus]